MHLQKLLKQGMKPISCALDWNNETREFGGLIKRESQIVSTKQRRNGRRRKAGKERQETELLNVRSREIRQDLLSEIHIERRNWQLARMKAGVLHQEIDSGKPPIRHGMDVGTVARGKACTTPQMCQGGNFGGVKQQRASIETMDQPAVDRRNQARWDSPATQDEHIAIGRKSQQTELNHIGELRRLRNSPRIIEDDQRLLRPMSTHRLEQLLGIDAPQVQAAIRRHRQLQQAHFAQHRQGATQIQKEPSGVAIIWLSKQIERSLAPTLRQLPGQNGFTGTRLRSEPDHPGRSTGLIQTIQ